MKKAYHKRVTVAIVMGQNPEKNRFQKVHKIYRRKLEVEAMQSAEHRDKAVKTAVDFEQFLWDNADANFYHKLRKQMRNRLRKA